MPASVTLTATAADSDGTIQKVEFFHGGTNLIATVTTAPYTFNWTNVAVGSYSLTAVATDNQGAPTTSAPVNITVNPYVAKLHFIEVDHLGTPRAIYDENDQLKWRWDQAEPFGVNVPDENPSALGQFEFPVRFPGQYFDKETNLNYNYHRDYDPVTGRYIQSDPIGLQAEVNTYSYVSADPANSTDPKGLFKSPGNLPGISTPGPVVREIMPSSPGIILPVVAGTVAVVALVVSSEDPDATVPMGQATPTRVIATDPECPDGCEPNYRRLIQAIQRHHHCNGLWGARKPRHRSVQSEGKATQCNVLSALASSHFVSWPLFMNSTLFIVTFTNKFPADYVKGLPESQFMGLCEKSEVTEDPKVLHLRPNKDEYEDLKAQLVELEEDGALSFVESRQ